MKRQNLRLALAQINSTVGDLEGNSKKIISYIQEAKNKDVDIISFPELAVTGYPPEDLLLRRKFIQDNIRYTQKIAVAAEGIVAVVGFVDFQKEVNYNAAAVCWRKDIVRIYHKRFLPNYGVFDEKRYFVAGSKSSLFRLGDIIFGVEICEDSWIVNGAVRSDCILGAKLIVSINASPYHIGKVQVREKAMQEQARKNKVFIAYTNLVGGQDELVFDGQSIVVDSEGKIVARAKAFCEDLLLVDLSIPASLKKIKKKYVYSISSNLVCPQKSSLQNRIEIPKRDIEEIYQALKLGLLDYVRKNNFSKVVLGLSGGIDSAFVATLAVDALGKENVVAVFMPSRYTSFESRRDARELAKNLGIKLIELSIDQIFTAFLKTLNEIFKHCLPDKTEENIQARIRGSLLMALSNKFGWLVLATGNKSEMSTGYATLYGDMAGGFAVIKDVPKTVVYKLSFYRNSINKVIPDNIITKAPTAELKPNQKDSDTLPEYNLLDAILKEYVEQDKDIESIVARGINKNLVLKVAKMVDSSEYKRRQAAPGIKITPKAFGKDRRMPITNKYNF